MNIEYYSALIWETVTIEFAIKFLLVYFFIVWIFLILWVARDISYRSSSLLFQLFCVFLMLIATPIGVILYLLIRPRKNLYEQYSEEIEANLEILHEIVEDRIHSLAHKQYIYCPNCGQSVKHRFDICPHCEHTLKKPCVNCGKKIRSNWNLCPYCIWDQNETPKKSVSKNKKKK